MPEGSTGPLRPDVPGSSVPHDAMIADRPQDARGLPPFPVSAAERAIETLSRFAGPAIFLLAIGGIVWLIAK
jgi:hypothetical protein